MYVLIKILTNIFFLTEMLFKFRKVSSLLCSFCKTHHGRTLHLCYGCSVVDSAQSYTPV